MTNIRPDEFPYVDTASRLLKRPAPGRLPAESCSKGCMPFRRESINDTPFLKVR
jgi:hypothetical protein